VIEPPGPEFIPLEEAIEGQVRKAQDIVDEMLDEGGLPADHWLRAAFREKARRFIEDHYREQLSAQAEAREATQH
jgi:hypothetical protein